MPELPEVETVRRDLARVLRGKEIARVTVRKPKLVRGVSPRRLLTQLRGRQIVGIRRRGKLLIFLFDDPEVIMLVHLKMTGQLIYKGARQLVAGGHGYPLVLADRLPTSHTHITFTFTDGSVLYFNDLRQFGYVQLISPTHLAALEAAYGVEPLSTAFTPAKLAEILHGRASSLKSVLLNQQLIAGLGNIYVDEASFAAGIRPTRRAGRVTGVEVAALHRAIRRVLRAALAARGTTFGSFRDGLGGEGQYVRKLKVYGRAGQRCQRLACRQAGVTLVRTVTAGRGTVYCPVCQR